MRQDFRKNVISFCVSRASKVINRSSLGATACARFDYRDGLRRRGGNYLREIKGVRYTAERWYGNRRVRGRGKILTEQPCFGKKGGTLNFIDVAHGAMQARTIEPGSVCEREPGQG